MEFPILAKKNLVQAVEHVRALRAELRREPALEVQGRDGLHPALPRNARALAQGFPYSVGERARGRDEAERANHLGRCNCERLGNHAADGKSDKMDRPRV